jgi:hypothetical protein
VALRCASLDALENRRLDLLAKGVAVGDILPLHPYRSFFLDDPVNGLRLEFTTRIADYTESDRDPEKRVLPMSIRLFYDAGRSAKD